MSEVVFSGKPFFRHQTLKCILLSVAQKLKKSFILQKIFAVQPFFEVVKHLHFGTVDNIGGHAQDWLEAQGKKNERKFDLFL